MLDKRIFCKFIDELDCYVTGMQGLEETLNVIFDNNFLTNHTDRYLDLIAQSFFTQNELEDPEHDIAIETVKDILYHYAFTSEFGLKTDKLKRLYVEDEGLDTEVVLNALNSAELYDVIIRYLHPPVVFKTCLINC